MGKLRNKFFPECDNNTWPHSGKIDKDELVYAYKIFKLNYEPLINELRNKHFSKDLFLKLSCETSRSTIRIILSIYDEICTDYEVMLQLIDSMEPQKFYLFAELLLRSIPKKVLSMCDKIYNIGNEFMLGYYLLLDNEADNVE